MTNFNYKITQSDNFKSRGCTSFNSTAVDNIALTNSIALTKSLDIPGLDHFKIIRGLTARNIYIPVGCLLVGWIGSIKTLPSFAINGNETCIMRDDYIENRLGRPIAMYKRIIDERGVDGIQLLMIIPFSE